MQMGIALVTWCIVALQGINFNNLTVVQSYTHYRVDVDLNAAGIADLSLVVCCSVLLYRVPAAELNITTQWGKHSAMLRGRNYKLVVHRCTPTHRFKLLYCGATIAHMFRGEQISLYYIWWECKFETVGHSVCTMVQCCAGNNGTHILKHP